MKTTYLLTYSFRSELTAVCRRCCVFSLLPLVFLHYLASPLCRCYSWPGMTVTLETFPVFSKLWR